MNLQTALQQLPETDKNVIAVLSGGLDSSIMTMLLVERYGKDRVFAVSYDYNQKQREELNRASALCKELGVSHQTLDLTILGEIVRPMCANISGTDVDMPTIQDVLGDPQPDTYVPNRNMILLSLTAAVAETQGASHIVGGWQQHDEYSYWDVTQAFIDNVNKVLSMNRKNPIKAVSPFAELSKTEELRLCQEMGKMGLLKHTLTCYNPNEKGQSCRKCPSCAERIKAFMNIKQKDPVEYSADVPWELYYENDQLAGKATYKDGKKHGPWERYDETGQLEAKATYKDGKKDGPFENYYENGQLEGKGAWKNGNPDGPWESYYPNGQLGAKGTYKDGEKDGPYEQYYDNGQLHYKATYQDGKKQGLYEIYHRDGQIDMRMECKNDELHGLWEAWLDDGNYYVRETFENGAQMSREVYENGKLIEEEEGY